MEIKGISGIGVSAAFPLDKASSSTSVSDGAGRFFKELVGKVNDLSQQSDQAIQKLATGENKNLHETMIAVEKASVSFLFMSQVRNKALEAYQEVMRMSV
ncbi:MAG: flagellar hook-basal body complex protein FliE [Trichlorobacter sp.]|uniref:flagellar hook-basal body complex protein FliE n=1 Tax=Trichlorobacter sp. TaxID=2911007 RepID=UPI00255F2C75|nr:flagellar hook-basal body complex protein FliE [Trichlorobacter sp.]MDK9717986.1 flagellar hook-basal body complex protein FliE [Trichlorobacter sp.]